MNEKKRSKTKIGVGYVVKAYIGDMGENTTEINIRRMRKEVVGCVLDVVEKKIFLVQIEDGQQHFYVRTRRLIWMSHYQYLKKRTR